MLGILAGSPAAQAGIRYGDVVLSVNGKRTQNMLDYVEAKGLRADGMTVVLFRDGAESTLELVFHKRSGAPDAAAILAEVIGMRVVSSETDAAEPTGGGEPD